MELKRFGREEPLAKEDTNVGGGLEEDGVRPPLFKGNLASYVAYIFKSIPCLNDQIIKQTLHMERVGNLAYIEYIHLRRVSCIND